MRRGVQAKKKKNTTTVLISVGLNVIVWGGLALLFTIHKIEANKTVDVTMLPMKQEQFKAVKPPAEKEVAKQKKSMPKPASAKAGHERQKPGPPHPHFMAQAPSTTGTGTGPAVQSGGTGTAGQLFNNKPAQKPSPKPLSSAPTKPPSPMPPPPPVKQRPKDITPKPVPLHEALAGISRPAQPIDVIKPVIPDSLRTSALSTSVIARINIASDGQMSVKLLTTSGSSQIDGIVLAALKKWTWSPQMIDGVAVPTVIDYKVSIEVS